MRPEEAKQIIEQALNQAFLKGAFSLQDAVMITDALQALYLESKVESSK